MYEECFLDGLLLLTGVESGHKDCRVNVEGGMPPTIREIQHLEEESKDTPAE